MVNHLNERYAFESTRTRVIQRDQKLFDGSMKVFESVEILWCVYILPIQDGKVLITRQKQPQKPNWYTSHVWGLVERDEDPDQCAIRELMEETGMTARSMKLYQKFETHWTLRQKRYVYVAKWLDIVSEQKLDKWWEIIELERLDVDTYIDHLIHRKLWAKLWREEVMLKVIDNQIEDFKKLLLE